MKLRFSGEIEKPSRFNEKYALCLSTNDKFRFKTNSQITSTTPNVSLLQENSKTADSMDNLCSDIVHSKN